MCHNTCIDSACILVASSTASNLLIMRCRSIIFNPRHVHRKLLEFKFVAANVFIVHIIELRSPKSGSSDQICLVSSDGIGDDNSERDTMNQPIITEYSTVENLSLNDELQH